MDNQFYNTMSEIKNVYRNCIRQSSLMDRGQGSEKIKRITIQKNKSDAFSMKVCETVIVMVDNILNKPQPINFTFHGIKGEIIACVSSNEHPDEKHN